MSQVMNAADVLQREFLGMRCRLIELAASLDRIYRAEGGPLGDARLDQIREACAVLRGDEAERAEKVQLVFSLPHDDQTEV